MNFKIIIPARYNSSRLPGKPLLDIAGKPMIQHVFERAKESEASEIIIATDDQRIEQVALAFGRTLSWIIAPCRPVAGLGPTVVRPGGQRPHPRTMWSG